MTGSDWGVASAGHAAGPAPRERCDRPPQPDLVKPGTAMPAMGVTEQDARDIAAYLDTLR